MAVAAAIITLLGAALLAYLAFHIDDPNPYERARYGEATTAIVFCAVVAILAGLSSLALMVRDPPSKLRRRLAHGRLMPSITTLDLSVPEDQRRRD